ncbi:hypothetical protein [Sulfurospirillum sp. UCH001]|uniref:hypothetical protein n=1 Tax=Sulfurospirillum sp. UCH001 TaxID=1581011 RepID=UPI00082B67C3|nr:hypothetical protein [Sulfurospirillum sp. UCH001]
MHWSKNIQFRDASFFYLLIILFSFFPYITLYSFGSDIQPWSIVSITLMSLLLFYNKIRFYNIFVFLFLPFLYSLFLLIVSMDYSSGVRSTLGYLTIGLVPFIFNRILIKHYELFVKFLKLTTIVYLIVGLIQILFDEQFMAFLLNRNTTTISRGVVSLSPEPTFYGIICLFLILLFISLDIKNKIKYIFLLLFQICFLAQSTMTIFFLLIFSFYYFLFKMNIKIVGLLCLSMFVTLIFIDNIDFVPQNIRLFQLISAFLNDPSNIVIFDASINERVSAIYFSIKGFIDNNFLPNGFGIYSQYLNHELPKQNIFWWTSESNRIMSFYGSILFEMGFIGFTIPFVYTIIIFRAYKNQIGSGLLYFFFINTILVSAIPLSFPFVGIYMATLLHKTRYKINKNIVNVK